MRVLVSAASRYGSTAEIAQAIADVLAAAEIDVTVAEPGQVGSVETYDAYVLGSAVYMGHWLEDAKELVERVCRTGEAAHAKRPIWLFSSGPVGDPARKLVQQMGVEEKELQRLMELTGAREHKLFAGRLQREQLNRRQRAALLVMRGMEGDFRDWSQIEQWARGIAGSLDSSALAAGAR